ncbi:MAG: hypothetical protein HYV63_19675 [Candidatus Schekmanbacteria bacterium]|nr:hypothetical protein [Candidatus Schekmanbacteria bacterium]
MPASYVIKGKNASPADREAARDMVDYWDTFVNLYSSSVDNSDTLGAPGNGTNEVNVFISSADSTSIYGISMSSDTYGVAALVPDASFGSFNECQDFSAVGCAAYTETDVVVNLNFSAGWTSDWWTDDNSPALVQTTVLHEVGHTLGLHHIFSLPQYGDSFSTLNYINDDSGRYVTRMDSLTAFTEYPAQAARASLVDVGVHNFVFGNSTYAETYATRNPATVQRGQNLTISNYLVQSPGSVAAPNVAVTWYLSADTTIATSDYVLGVADFSTLSANSETDQNVQLPVPMTIPDGVYYIGAIITTGGQQDAVTWNNVAILGHGARLQVTVSGGGSVDPTATATRTPGQGTPSATATRTPTSGSSTPSATPTTTRTSTPSPTRTPTPDLPVSYSGWVNNEQGCWCGRFPNSALPAAYVVKGKDATSADREAARSMIDYWDRFVNIYDTSVDNSNVLGTPGNGTNEVNVFISAAESTTIYGISMDANTYGVAAMVPDAAFGAFNECQSFSATGCNQFTETDVVINADFGSGWTSDWWNDGGSPALVQTTALHEVGHTVGLHHIFTLPAFGDSYSTMNYINDDSGKFVTRMDSKTVFAEYPAQAQRAALVDVGVYSFVFGNNQYGETYATRAPASLPRGQNLTISNYMVQSAGSIAASNVVVSWYLSTDVDVPAGDFLLGTVELGALNPDTESDLNAMLPVPQYVPDGTYYIGALIRVAGSEDTVGHNNVTLLGHGTRLTVQVSGGGAVDPTPTPTPTPQATPSPTQPAAVPVGEGGQWALLLVLMSAGLAVAYRLGRRKEAWSRHTTA